MFLKTKRKLSLVMAMILLLTMVPVGAFAANGRMELIEPSLYVKYDSEEHKGAKPKESGKGTDPVFIYYPVIYFFTDQTIDKLDGLTNKVDSNFTFSSKNIKMSFASSSSNKKIVRSNAYVAFGNDKIGSDGEIYEDKNFVDPNPSGENLKGEGLGRFGYIKIRMNGTGGVGTEANMVVSFEVDELYNGSYRTYLNIVIQPGDKGDTGLPAPDAKWSNTKASEITGWVEWVPVEYNNGSEYSRQEYELTLVKQAANGSQEWITDVTMSESAAKEKLRYDFTDLIYQNGSGNYYFQIAAVGNRKENGDPEGTWTKISDPLKYAESRVEIADATKLEWKTEKNTGAIYSEWTAPKNIDKKNGVDSYDVYLYRDNNSNYDEQIPADKPLLKGIKSNINKTTELYDYIQTQLDAGHNMDGSYFFRIQPRTGRKLAINDGQLSKVSNILEVKGREIFIDGNSVTGKVNQAALKLTAKPTKINVGEEATLSVSGGSSKGAVEYKTIAGGSNAGSGNITGNKFKASRPGVVRLQATMKGLKVKDKDYNDVLSNIVEILVEVSPVILESKSSGNSSVLVIPEEKIQDLIALAPYQEHGAAVISPGSKGKTTSVAVPIKALDKLAGSSKVKGVAVAFPSGMKIRMDSSALDSVLKQAKGEHVIFNIKETKSSEKTITAAQKAFLDKQKPAKVYDISITSDGKVLYSSEASNKGTIYVTLPYTAKDINAVPELYHLDSKGYSNKEYSEYDINHSEVIAELDHLSIYYLLEGQASAADGKAKLTFATNGGSTIKVVEETRGNSVNLSYYTSSRAGFVFDGWYSDPDLTKSISRVTLSGDTTVYAKWLPVNTFSGFSDVPYNAWYKEAIQTMLEYDIMGGVSGTQFAPNQATTRGMIVTILYRLEGSPASKSGSKFADVKSNAYYNNAVAWASSNKIVQGYGDNKFGPNDSITREQMASILKSYSAYKKYDTSASARIGQFKDFSRVSNYAMQSVEWAVGEQLIGGKGNGLLDPRGKATRAEVASIFQRYLETFL